MEIKISSRQMLKLLYVLSWILFIAVCIEAGSFVFNAAFTFMWNSAAAGYFQLSELYTHDPGYFLVELLLMSIAGVLKALLFYLILKLLHERKLNMQQPFNRELGRFMFHVVYLTLGIGLFSHWGVAYTEWLAGQGIKMPDISYLHLDGADVWLFMSVTFFVIAHIFKRGIEIQSENELTI